jgi:hypothetical protein
MREQPDSLDRYRGTQVTVSGFDKGASVSFSTPSSQPPLVCNGVTGLAGNVNGAPMVVLNDGTRSTPVVTDGWLGPQVNGCEAPLLQIGGDALPHEDPLVFKLTDGDSTFRVTVENPWQPETVRLVSASTTVRAGDRVELELLPSENRFGEPPGRTQTPPSMDWVRLSDFERLALEDVRTDGNRISGTVPAGTVFGEGALVAYPESHRMLPDCEGFGSCALQISSTVEGRIRRLDGITLAR